jgi:hypothetical protein
MTIKKQLWQEIESSSDEFLSETLFFLQDIKTKNTEPKKLVTTKKSLLEHLQTLNYWSGDDENDLWITA